MAISIHFLFILQGTSTVWADVEASVLIDQVMCSGWQAGRERCGIRGRRKLNPGALEQRRAGTPQDDSGKLSISSNRRCGA